MNQVDTAASPELSPLPPTAGTTGGGYHVSNREFDWTLFNPHVVVACVMSATQVADEVSHEIVSGVGIWSVTDITKASDSGALDAGEEHFRDVAAQDSMAAVVVEIGGADQLPEDFLSRVESKWTDLAEATGVEAVAYVADGISRLAISNKNKASGVDTDAFTDRQQAVEWASNY